MGTAWVDHDLVFCNTLGRPIEPTNMLHRAFQPLLQRAELPRIRFHDLRHTCATVLLLAGERPKVVQEMLGHGSIALTMDTYSHVLPSMQEDAASKMEQLLGRSKGA
jgi:integrase